VITEVAPVTERIVTLLSARPRTFYELLRALDDVEYRTILKAWGARRERHRLGRGPHGVYLSRAE